MTVVLPKKMKLHSILCVFAFLCVFPLLAEGEFTRDAGEAVRVELLENAKAWGVPQPKAGSSLVKVWVFKSGDRDYYALGFREEENAKRALVGFDYWDITERVDVKDVPDPKKVSLENITPTSPFSEVNGVNFGLVTGLQLLGAGNTEIGTELIKKSLREEAGHPRSAFRSSAGESPVIMLARNCLADAMNRISSEKPDFPAIKQRMESILKDQPQLKSKATDWALQGLEASVQHNAAQPGTIESLIDAYLLSGGKEGGMMRGVGKITEAERALVVKGFEAVPALLQARKSRRFTNHVMQGFNNFTSYPMSADQVINAYLQRLANDEFGVDWLDRQMGYTAENDVVLAWWEKASKMGEKAYVANHTITPVQKDGATLSSELLLLAKERYPELLPDLYKAALKTSVPSWPIAEALVGSNAPIEQKLSLLSAGIASNHRSHRNSALSLLQSLNVGLADEQLIRLLKNAPKTVKEEYWTDQDAGLGRLVSVSVNVEVWNAFHGLLKRADLGMQMELIDHLEPARDAPPQISQSYYRIYDRFRNDERVRDNSTSKKFSGPGAGFSHERLSMRDYVHIHWASWLDLKLKSPQVGASPKEWHAYRVAVSQVIEKARVGQGATAPPTTRPLPK